MTAGQRVPLVIILVALIEYAFTLVVVPGTNTWPAAYSSCKSRGDYLPPYENQKGDIQTAMTTNNLQSAWLGLKRHELYTWLWLDNMEADPRFTSGKWGGHMKCGTFHLRDNALEADNCTLKRYGYLCQAQEPCARLSVSTTNCIQLVNVSVMYFGNADNWYDAHYRCQREGYQLAILRDQASRDILFNQWYKTDKKDKLQVWIGLRKQEWRYQNDGNTDLPSLQTQWAPGQPSQAGDCAVVFRDQQGRYLWRAENCQKHHSAMCMTVREETTLKPTEIPRVTRTTSVFSTTNNTVGVDPQAQDPPPNRSSNTGAIVGAVLGVLLVACLAGAAMIFVLRRRRSKETPAVSNPDDVELTIPLRHDDGVDGSDAKQSWSPRTTQVPASPSYPVKTGGNPFESAEHLESVSQVPETEIDDGGSDSEVYPDSDDSEPIFTYSGKERQVFDADGGEFKIPHSDVILTVPEGAVPQGEKYAFMMKVHGDFEEYAYQAPEGQKIISPIPEIDAPYTFNKPLKLVIPHKFEQATMLREINLYYRKTAANPWKKAQRKEKGIEQKVSFMVRPGKVIVYTTHFTQFMCTCNGSRIRKLGLTAVLFAEPHDRPAESSYQEVTLRIYMMEWMHNFRESIQSLRSKQKGIMIRKDMLIDMPVQPAVQQSDLLDMTIGCRGRTWRVDGNDTQTKQLYHLVSCHQGGPWRLAAEFVIRGDGRPEATNTFRVDLKFNVRRQKQEQVQPRGRVQKELKDVTTTYTEHVDMGKIFSRLERRRQRRAAGGSTVGSPAAAWVENLTFPRSGHSGSFHLPSSPPASTNQDNETENRKESDRDLQKTTPPVEKPDTASSQRSTEPDSSRTEDTQPAIKKEEDGIKKQTETPRKVPVTPAVTRSEDSGSHRQEEMRSKEKEASKQEETPTSTEKGKDKSMVSKIKERMSFRKSKSEKDKRISAKGPEEEELLKSSAADSRSIEPESAEESDNKASIKKQVTAPSGGEETHDVQRSTVAPSISPVTEISPSPAQKEKMTIITERSSTTEPTKGERSSTTDPTKTERSSTSEPTETPTSAEKGKGRSMTSKLKGKMSFRKSKSEKDSKRKSSKGPKGEHMKSPIEADSSEDIPDDIDKVFEEYKKETGISSTEPETPEVSPNDDSGDTRNVEESDNKASVQKQTTTPSGDEAKHDIPQSTVTPSLSPSAESTPPSVDKEKVGIKRERSSTTEAPETPTSAEKGKSMTLKVKARLSFRKSKGDKDEKPK